MISHIVDIARKNPELVRSELPSVVGLILRNRGTVSNAKSLLETNLKHRIMDKSSALKLLHHVSKFDLNWAKIYLSKYFLRGIISEEDLYKFRSKMHFTNKRYDLAVRDVMVGSDLYDIAPVDFLPHSVIRSEKAIYNMQRLFEIFLKYATKHHKYAQISEILNAGFYLNVEPSVSNLIHLSLHKAFDAMKIIFEKDPDILTRLFVQNLPYRSVNSILNVFMTMPYSRAHVIFGEYLLRESYHSMIKQLANNFEDSEELQLLYIRSLFREGKYDSAYNHILEHPSLPNLRIGMSYFRWDTRRLANLYRIANTYDQKSALLYYISSIENINLLMELKEGVMALDSEKIYSAYMNQLISLVSTDSFYGDDEVVPIAEELAEYFDHSCLAVSSLLDLYRVTNNHSKWFELYSQFRDHYHGSPRFMVAVFNMQRSSPFISFEELKSMSEYIEDYLRSVSPLLDKPYSVIYPLLSYARSLYHIADDPVKIGDAYDIVLRMMESFENASFRESFLRESTNLMYGSRRFSDILDLIYSYESVFGRSLVTEVYRSDIYTEWGFTSDAKELLIPHLKAFNESPYYPNLLYANSVKLSICLAEGRYEDVIDNFEMHLKYYLSSIRGHKEIFRAFVDYVISLDATGKPMDLPKLNRAYHRYQRATPFRVNKTKIRKVKDILWI